MKPIDSSGIEMLTRDELSAHLGVSVSWLQKQCKAKLDYPNTPHLKIGKRIYFIKREVDAWNEQRKR
ncbi:MAG: helix-turn-helix domain-containing protein [Endomicrobium sp.]|nr:helix-turn-helix domain-containing protein [Endomicrobium sp.]